MALDELSPVESATESRALPICSAASARCGLVVLQRRPEVRGFDERLASLQQLLAGDRLGASFLVDLGLYTGGMFQSWLIPDDLKRRGVSSTRPGSSPTTPRAMPFVGLIAYKA